MQFVVKHDEYKIIFTQISERLLYHPGRCHFHQYLIKFLFLILFLNLDDVWAAMVLFAGKKFSMIFQMAVNMDLSFTT